MRVGDPCSLAGTGRLHLPGSPHFAAQDPGHPWAPCPQVRGACPTTCVNARENDEALA
jgi:hypothetical protein